MADRKKKKKHKLANFDLLLSCHLHCNIFLLCLGVKCFVFCFLEYVPAPTLMPPNTYCCCQVKTSLAKVHFPWQISNVSWNPLKSTFISLDINPWFTLRCHVFIWQHRYVSGQNETFCMFFNTWTADLNRVKQHTGRLTKALFAHMRRTSLQQEIIFDPSAFQFLHKAISALFIFFQYPFIQGISHLSLCLMNGEIEAMLLLRTGTH